MKKLIVIVLALLIFCCFTACDSYNDMTADHAESTFEEMGFVVVKQLYVQGDTCAYIVYDPSTKVEYIIYDGYRSYSICPYYDENGNIAFYKGD